MHVLFNTRGENYYMADDDTQYTMETLFELKHKNIPKSFSKKVIDSIKITLWYAPDAESFQHADDYILNNVSSSEELFMYFYNHMGLQYRLLCQSEQNDN